MKSITFCDFFLQALKDKENENQLETNSEYSEKPKVVGKTKFVQRSKSIEAKEVLSNQQSYCLMTVAIVGIIILAYFISILIITFQVSKDIASFNKS